MMTEFMLKIGDIFGHISGVLAITVVRKAPVGTWGVRVKKRLNLEVIW